MLLGVESCPVSPHQTGNGGANHGGLQLLLKGP